MRLASLNISDRSARLREAQAIVVNTMLPGSHNYARTTLVPGLQLESGFIFAPANNDTTVRG